MFANISKAGLGMYIVVLTQLISYIFGINLDVNTTTDAVFTVIQAIGAILWVVGQLTRQDLSWGIFRKNEQNTN
jgi:uncharacterized membrane protein